MSHNLDPVARDRFLRAAIASLIDDNTGWPGLWTRIESLLDERDEYHTALQRVYMWISDPALREDEDTALVEARRICRETLPTGIVNA